MASLRSLPSGALPGFVKYYIAKWKEDGAYSFARRDDAASVGIGLANEALRICVSPRSLSALHLATATALVIVAAELAAIV